MLAKKAEPLKETTPLTDSVLEERFLFFPSKCWCICPFQKCVLEINLRKGLMYVLAVHL